jgi:hypothetical protein
MVCSDGARDRSAETLYGFDRFLRCGMFQYDAQAGKVLMEGFQMFQKVSFRVEDACVLMRKDELGAREDGGTGEPTVFVSEGTSPCRLRTISWVCISWKTG